MKTYTRPNGDIITPYYDVETDLYADLVAAIEIGRALEAKCVRLEDENRALWAELNRLTLAS